MTGAARDDEILTWLPTQAHTTSLEAAAASAGDGDTDVSEALSVGDPALMKPRRLSETRASNHFPRRSTMAGCGCGTARKNTVWLLEYEQGGCSATEHATKTDAELADARNGGGDTIRLLSK